MKKLLILAAAVAAVATAASAETVQCPATAAPGACAQNQSIHDAFLAGSAYGPNPVWSADRVDNRTYLGSDPDPQVRLMLAKRTLDGGGSGPSPSK